jgi:DNA-binding transcriptional MerR regulator/methylmalonyl-CoA mutase cobalamin-binding subunit
MSDAKAPGERLHPIQVVARRTGLSADLIRVWERRYDAIRPRRTETNRRLYTDDDVHRLLLLRRATRGGRRIGDVAKLTREELERLVSEDETAAAGVSPPPAAGTRGASLDAVVESCIESAEAMDSERLERVLAAAAIEHSTPDILEKLIRPLMIRVGERWRDGSLRVCQEHLTSAIVRSFLHTKNGHHASSDVRPGVVVTTPVGQLHELGALMVAVTASLDGWHATYLGPNLPAEEIAAAALQLGSKAVALSLLYPADDPGVDAELRRIRSMLPETTLIVGGAAADGYAGTLEEIGALRAGDLASLRETLDSVRYGS